MTAIETLAVWLAIAASAIVLFAAVGAAAAEVTVRRSTSRGLRLQEIRDLLDRDEGKGTASDGVEVRETIDRDRLLKEAKRAFDGVLTRDLERDAHLAELFTDVCRILTPTSEQRLSGHGEP